MGRLLNVLFFTDGGSRTKEAEKCCSPQTSGYTSANVKRV